MVREFVRTDYGCTASTCYGTGLFIAIIYSQSNVVNTKSRSNGLNSIVKEGLCR